MSHIRKRRNQINLFFKKKIIIIAIMEMESGGNWVEKKKNVFFPQAALQECSKVKNWEIVFPKNTLVYFA